MFVDIRKLFLRKKGEIPTEVSPSSFPMICLSTESKLLDDSSVSLNISLLEIVKDTTSLTNELQQRTTCRVVFLVGFQMLCKMSDTVGK